MPLLLAHWTQSSDPIPSTGACLCVYPSTYTTFFLTVFPSTSFNILENLQSRQWRDVGGWEGKSMKNKRETLKVLLHCRVADKNAFSVWETVFPVKTVNTWEKFWNVYCFATNQMWDETTTDNRQTAALISHHLIWNNELACSWTNSFTVFFKYWNFSFSISALVSPKNRYEWHFMEKRC